MKQLSRLDIQRMIDTSGSAGSGGSGGNDISLAGYATEAWVEDNYLSKEFFLRLFGIHGTDENDDPVDVEPNDPDTTITDIEAMFGFWTEQYISALGQGSGGGGGGGSDTLAGLIDVDLTNPVAGQVLKFNGTKWVNSAASAGTVTSVAMSVPTGFAVTGSPITVSGVLGLSFADGYSLPTTAKQTNWDAAYSWTSVSRTTLADYGITDAKFGTPGTDSIQITLGSTTQSVLTQHQSLANYYTKSETDGKFLTISFFRSLFRAYNSSNTEVEPNDGSTSTIASIKAMFGFWTEQYISALGQSSGGGGGTVSLCAPLDNINTYITSLPSSSQDGVAFVWNKATSKFVYSTASGAKLSVNGGITAGAASSINGNLSVTGNVEVNGGGFVKSDSSNDFVLLAGGGTAKLSDIGGGSYLPLSGGTMTGNIIQGSGGTYITRFTSDNSQHNIGLLWQNTSESRIASISYRNNTQEMFLNSTGADTIYQDAIGKYNLVVGNGKLTYNTYNIWHAGNLDITSRGIVVGGINYNFYSASNTALNLDNAYLQLTGGTVSGNITTYTGSASTSQFIVKNYRARVGSTSSSWANSLVAMTAEGESGDSTIFRLAVYGGLNSTTNQQEVKYGYIGQGGYDNANNLRIYPTYPAWGTNMIWHEGNFNPSDYVTTSALTTTLGDYVTLGTAQTITGVKTFKSTSSVASVMAFSYGSNAGGNIYVDSSARLHIDSATDEALYIGYGSSASTSASGTKALVLLSSAFKPANISTGVFDLGTSSGRWNGIYGQTLNMTSDATIGGTLGVTGAATLSSTLDVTGLTTLSDYLYMDTGKPIYWKDNGNTYRNVLYLVYTSSANLVRLGYGTASQGYNTYIYGNNVRLLYGTSRTTGLQLDSSGNVGIGTTSPSAKLHVNGAVRIGSIYIGEDSNGNLEVYKLDSSNNHTAANFYATGAVSALGIGSSSSGLSLCTPLNNINSNISANPAVNGATFVWNGNTSKFVYSNTSGQTLNAYNISVSSALSAYTGSFGSTLEAVNMTVTGGNLTVQTGNLTVSAGRAGIAGATSSSYTLYVHGNIRSNYLAIGATETVNSLSCATIKTLSSRGLAVQTASNSPCYTNVAWSVSSDMRLKHIVANAGASIEQIADAPIFNFRWLSGGNDTILGSSAQYWQTVFPCAVRGDMDSFLSMDYGGIALASAVMVARKVQSHEERIAALEAENARLQKELNEIKAA